MTAHHRRAELAVGPGFIDMGRWNDPDGRPLSAVIGVHDVEEMVIQFRGAGEPTVRVGPVWFMLRDRPTAQRFAQRILACIEGTSS